MKNTDLSELNKSRNSFCLAIILLKNLQLALTNLFTKQL